MHRLGTKMATFFTELAVGGFCLCRSLVNFSISNFLYVENLKFFFSIILRIIFVNIVDVTTKNKIS